jgi:hypothetical protein
MEAHTLSKFKTKVLYGLTLILTFFFTTKNALILGSFETVVNELSILGRQLPTISEATTTTAFTNLSSNTSPEKESYVGQNRKDQNIIDDLPSCDVMVSVKHLIY